MGICCSTFKYFRKTDGNLSPAWSILEWHAMLDYRARVKTATIAYCVVLALYLDVLGSFTLLTPDMCHGAEICPD